MFTCFLKPERTHYCLGYAVCYVAHSQRWPELITNKISMHQPGFGQWKEANDGYYHYHASDIEKIWARKMDKQYLLHLAKENPLLFLKEMTPNTKHTGFCIGLDPTSSYHQALQKALYPEIERICCEQKRFHHPSLNKIYLPQKTIKRYGRTLFYQALQTYTTSAAKKENKQHYSEKKPLSVNLP